MPSLSLLVQRSARYIVQSIFLIVILTIPLMVGAVDLGGLEQTATTAGISQTPATPEVATARIISQILSFVGILFLALMLYAGFVWMTAGGDDKRIDTARSIIQNALIGLIIVIAAYAITQFVGQSIINTSPAP